MRVAFDVKRMRPACVIVAAGLGASPEAAALFPVDSWLLAPTKEMAVYETTPEQLAILVGRVKDAQRGEIAPSEPASSSALRQMHKSWATAGPGKRHARRARRMDAGER